MCATTTWSGPSSVSSTTTGALPLPPPSAASSRSAEPESTNAETICPPAKPSSTRTRSSGTGHNFREDAVNGVGMDECDLEAEHPSARRLVDQLRAGARKVVERSSDVVHLIGDVMHARPALREETADRRVVAERSEELDAALPHADRR